MIAGMLSTPPIDPVHSGKTPEKVEVNQAAAPALSQPVSQNFVHSGDPGRKKRQSRSLFALFRDIKDVLFMAVGKDDSDDYECNKG
jgi:hypothetical protein